VEVDREFGRVRGDIMEPPLTRVRGECGGIEVDKNEEGSGVFEKDPSNSYTGNDVYQMYLIYYVEEQPFSDRNSVYFDRRRSRMWYDLVSIENRLITTYL
jgi:hypothetical protein